MTSPLNIPPKHWQIAPLVPAALKTNFTHLNSVLLQLLYNRGLTDSAQMQAFVEGYYLDSDDPFLLPDMDTAVERIARAIGDDEHIVVYGDFDADGVTSTVLLVETLRGLVGMERRNVRPYIPDRVDEGYGLNQDALTKIKEEFGASLVITVDCGIRSIPEVEHANEIGLDLIITDHHSIGPKLPPALAVINPKRADCSYPEKMLAGVGIAYKLAQALHDSLPSKPDFSTRSLLDLVAIGTIADVAPLLGENRRLVTEGLDVLNTLNRPGVSALAGVSGVKKGGITAEAVGYSLGPRINAAGRLHHAYDAAKLLATDNFMHASQMANSLNQLNRQRQQLTAELNQLAESIIEDVDSRNLLIAAHENFVSGVVGLVAGRLKENYYRPTIILEKGETESHGSCRSIPEVHITHMLDQVSDLLERYGGHAQAAGLTIRNENLPEFEKRITEAVEAELVGQDLRPTIVIDQELALEEIDWALHDTLQSLEPTGCANMTPVFMSRSVQVSNPRRVGKDKTHLQMEIPRNDMLALKTIAFGLGAWESQLSDPVDIAYSINANEYRGNRTLQLMIQDIRKAES